MKLLLAPLAAAILALSAQADTSELVGNASTRARPEYVQFQVMIESKCFPSRAALKAEQDAVVKMLQSKLKSLVGEENKTNHVKVNVGVSQPYVHTLYNEDGKKETVCANTFTRDTTITITTDKLDNFSDFFDTVNNNVDEAMLNREGSIRSHSTAATVTSPQSMICENTRTELRNTVLRKAREDAQEQFHALFDETGVCFETVRIVNTKIPTTYSEPMSYAKAEMRDGSGRIEITLEDIVVSVSHLFTFKFENCCPFKGPARTASSLTDNY